MLHVLPMTRRKRLAAQLVLLPALYLLSVPNPLLFSTLIAYVLLAPPAVTTTVAALLTWTSRQAPEVETLRERADDAVTAALQSYGAAGVGVVVLLANIGVQLPGKPALSILAWVCLLIGVPALGWLGAWRRHWMPLLRRRRAADAAAAAASLAPVDTAEVPPPL